MRALLQSPAGLVPAAGTNLPGWLAQQLHASVLPASATLASLLPFLPSKLSETYPSSQCANASSSSDARATSGSTASSSSQSAAPTGRLGWSAFTPSGITIHPLASSSRLYASIVSRRYPASFIAHSLTQQQRHASTAGAAALADLDSSSSSDSESEAEPSPDEFRARHSMHVISDYPVPDPAQTFDDARFPAPLLRALKEQGFPAPSPIQAQAWPVALSGQDLVAIAATGSGKTLGFLLPGFVHIKRTQKEKDRALGPTMLVVAPTRELAHQIHKVVEQQGNRFGIYSACLVGGEDARSQMQQLRAEPQVVVACPGRLLDFVERGRVNLSQVSYLVLDEADRMLDMGFEPDVRQISSLAEQDHQTLFFSATWPKEVERIASRLCRNDPVHVFMGDVADGPVANKDISQHVAVVPRHGKLEAMVEWLQPRLAEKSSKAIIFCNKRDECDWVAEDLFKKHGVRAVALHGDKKQSQRDYILQNFRSGRSSVLVATDVAARGLDISGVRAVVNYDFPMEFENYIHRIGRTGRAGATGDSLALLTANEAKAAAQLVKVLREVGQEVPEDVMKLARGADAGGRGGSSRYGGGGGRGGGYGRGGGGGRGRGGDRYGGSGGRRGGSDWRQWDDSRGGDSGGDRGSRREGGW